MKKTASGKKTLKEKAKVLWDALLEVLESLDSPQTVPVPIRSSNR
jgi:hypothetical protein